MEATAIRPVDPAELPELVLEAVRIADDAQLVDEDRALLLPVIFDVLCRRTIVPSMPSVIADPKAILRGFGGAGL